MLRSITFLALLIALSSVSWTMAAVEPLPPVAAEHGVLIFVVDSPVDRRFLEGRVAGLRSSDIGHGSLVARVVRSYCSAPVRSVSVHRQDGFNRAAYLDGLREVLAYVTAHPQVRVLVNISLGRHEREPAEGALIRQVIQAGAMVVAAAGNDNTEKPQYPAAYDGVVAVASATSRGKIRHSSYGSHIRLSASGDISFMDYEFLPVQRLQREMEAHGTSFAAPRVVALLAYVLQRRPGFSPADALALLEKTASPIDDELYDQGLLGAGLLNVYRAKSRVSPLHQTLHYVLPTTVFVALGVLTLALCWQHGLIGVFVSLLLWLVALPTAVLAVMETLSYMEFVGSGSVGVGACAVGILAAGLGIGAIVVHGNLPKAVLASLPAVALTLVAVGAAPMGPLAVMAVSAAVAVACAALVERRTRKVLARLDSLPDGSLDGSAAAVRLARTRDWAVDRRVKRACVQAVLRLPLETARQALAAEGGRSIGARELLAKVEEKIETEHVEEPEDLP